MTETNAIKASIESIEDLEAFEDAKFQSQVVMPLMLLSLKQEGMMTEDKKPTMAEIISQVMQKLNKLSPEDRARAVEVLASIYKGD